MLNVTMHLKHPCELLVRLLHSRSLRLHIVLADDQEAHALECGLQVGAIVYHGPDLHHDLRAHA
jgi:hypothetical protein